MRIVHVGAALRGRGRPRINLTLRICVRKSGAAAEGRPLQVNNCFPTSEVYVTANQINARLKILTPQELRVNTGNPTT